MNLAFFTAMMFLLQIACFIAARSFSSKMETAQDYFLAGKEVTLFPLVMTFLATQIGGGLILGSAEEAYQWGWAVLAYPLGQCLGFVALALGIGKKMASYQVATVAALMGKIYRSNRLKKLASLFSILSLFMIFVAQIIASKKFMISLGLQIDMAFFAFWAIVILYTALGGFKAVIVTDVIQASFFILTFIATLIYVLFYSRQPVHQEVWLLPDLAHSWPKICSWVTMPFLFMMIEQDMAQRCFAAKSPKVVSAAAAIAAMGTFLICIIPVYFGVLAKTLAIEPLPGASIFLTVIEKVTTPTISALVGTAVLAAIISTADSLINAIASNIAQDFQVQSSIQSAKGLTLAIALIGIFFAFQFDRVVPLLIQSYELSVSCLFIPIVLGLFRERGNQAAAFTSLFCGLFSFLLLKMVSLAGPAELYSVLISLVGYLAAEVFFKERQ